VSRPGSMAWSCRGQAQWHGRVAARLSGMVVSRPGSVAWSCRGQAQWHGRASMHIVRRSHNTYSPH
ncbi:hypothetical protein LSAT2_020753, partial [Lamellibrachia satsuma]